MMSLIIVTSKSLSIREDKNWRGSTKKNMYCALTNHSDDKTFHHGRWESTEPLTDWRCRCLTGENRWVLGCWMVAGQGTRVGSHIDYHHLSHSPPPHTHNIAHFYLTSTPMTMHCWQLKRKRDVAKGLSCLLIVCFHCVCSLEVLLLSFVIWQMRGKKCIVFQITYA